MALTALDLYKRVARKVGLDPNITAFSDADESNDVLQDLNESYEELLSYLPDDYAGVLASGSITLVPSQRTYSVAADALNTDLISWSFTDTTNNYRPITVTTREWLETFDPQYKTRTEPEVDYVYLEPSNLLAFYPVPTTAATITYDYNKSAGASRASETTDVFPLIPDKWCEYLVHRAQVKYEMRKGFGGVELAQQIASDRLGEIVAEVWEANPTRITGKGFA